VLVFTRRVGESIVIGDGIEVHVMRVGNNAVRIGIAAPADVPVHRREIYDLVRAANAAAATSDADAASVLAKRLRQSAGRGPGSVS